MIKDGPSKEPVDFVRGYQPSVRAGCEGVPTRVPTRWLSRSEPDVGAAGVDTPDERMDGVRNIHYEHHFGVGRTFDVNVAAREVEQVVQNCSECQSIDPSLVHWEKGNMDVSTTWHSLACVVTRFGGVNLCEAFQRQVHNAVAHCSLRFQIAPYRAIVRPYIFVYFEPSFHNCSIRGRRTKMLVIRPGEPKCWRSDPENQNGGVCDVAHPNPGPEDQNVGVLETDAGCWPRDGLGFERAEDHMSCRQLTRTRLY